MKLAKKRLPIALSLFVTGCQGSLPIIQVLTGADRVTVIERDEQAVISIGTDCEARGRVTSVDGIVNSGAIYFEGTMDRAIMKLRNEAVRAGANYVVITEKWESYGSGPGMRGYAIELYADAYKCPIEAP